MLRRSNYKYIAHKSGEEALYDLESDPFELTNLAPVLRLIGGFGKKDMAFPSAQFVDSGHLLFDLEQDPRQLRPIEDEETEERMVVALIKAMQENDSPPEQFARLGLAEQAGSQR